MLCAFRGSGRAGASRGGWAGWSCGCWSSCCCSGGWRAWRHRVRLRRRHRRRKRHHPPGRMMRRGRSRRTSRARISSYSPSDPSASITALQAFVAPGLAGSIAPQFGEKAARQAVGSVSVARVASLDSTHALVTVAAAVNGATKYLTVPVARDSHGGLVVSDPPSFAAPPARATVEEPVTRRSRRASSRRSRTCLGVPARLSRRRCRRDRLSRPAGDAGERARAEACSW